MRKNYYKKQSKGILDGSLTKKISDRNVPWPKCTLTEMFCDRKVPWPKCSVTEMFSDRNVPWPKCSVTEMFRDRNVLWPKSSVTEMFPDRKDPWPKCSVTEKFRDRNVPWPKRSVTEMFCDRKVLTEMSLCRNVSDRNVKQAKILGEHCEFLLERFWISRNFFTIIFFRTFASLVVQQLASEILVTVA